jgi:hypothetical protein
MVSVFASSAVDRGFKPWVSNCSDLFLNKHDDKSHGTGALAFLKARQPETRSLGISLILEYSSAVA